MDNAAGFEVCHALGDLQSPSEQGAAGQRLAVARHVAGEVAKRHEFRDQLHGGGEADPEQMHAERVVH